MADDELIEQLAALAHEQWAGWIRYMFEKCEIVPGGALLLPAWAVERWTRQMQTPYAELTEAEKGSDRAEARRVLAMVPSHWQRWVPDSETLREIQQQAIGPNNQLSSMAAASLYVQALEADAARLRVLVDDARRERDELRGRMHGIYDLARASFDDPRIAELQNLLIEAQGIIQFGGRAKSANREEPKVARTF